MEERLPRYRVGHGTHPSTGPETWEPGAVSEELWRRVQVSSKAEQEEGQAINVKVRLKGEM